MIHKNLKKYVYSPSTTLQQAIHGLYHKKAEICLVCGKSGRLEGVLTIGDIDQAILNGLDPSSPITAVMNVNYVSAHEKAEEAELKKLS